MNRNRHRFHRRACGLAVLAALAGCLSAAFGASREAPPAKAERYVVTRGDTLWGIAARAEAPRTDRRLLVRMLQEVNRLPSAALHPGQVILVPVGRDSVRRAVRCPREFANQCLVLLTSQPIRAPRSPGAMLL